MTDAPEIKTGIEVQAAAPSRRDTVHRPQQPIVPSQTVSGNALVLVIAIMSFLSCLTLGTVALIRDSASVWQSQISREATIQIKPVDGVDMEEALASAQRIASGFAGVREAKIVDPEATARLLSPWLGEGIDLNELPVPRLVIVTIDENSPPDFAAMRGLLTAEVKGASLDDHRTWVNRLVSMARTTVIIGLIALALMLSATVLTVIFATRGAMVGNGQIIEVLHFVGADSSYIAREFRQHFLRTGIKGAAGGGFIAILIFLALGWWTSRNLATPEADQAIALFGDFTIGISGYVGIAVVIVAVAALTAVTSHLTVIAYLHDIEMPGREA